MSLQIKNDPFLKVTEDESQVNTITCLQRGASESLGIKRVSRIEKGYNTQTESVNFDMIFTK